MWTCSVLNIPVLFHLWTKNVSWPYLHDIISQHGHSLIGERVMGQGPSIIFKHQYSLRCHLWQNLIYSAYRVNRGYADFQKKLHGCTIVIHTFPWKFAYPRLTGPSGPIGYSILNSQIWYLSITIRLPCGNDYFVFTKNYTLSSDWQHHIVHHVGGSW